MKNEGKYIIAKIINTAVCLAVTVFGMRDIYETWSLYGEYTAMSFFASLLYHGTLGVAAYLVFDYCLCKLFEDYV